MANKIVTVLEADGVTLTDITILEEGRQLAATSKSVALSAEDYAAIDGIEATLGTIDGRLEDLTLAQPLPTGAATQTTLATRLSEADFDTKIGSLTETAPGTDTASSGLNGRLQRIAQRITSLIALLPTALGLGGGLKVDDIFSQYETVAASTTAKMGATGAQGDYLAGVLVIPGTAAAGIVQIQDGNGAAITIFAGGGTTALSDLKPFLVPLGLYATSATTGGWNVITNANVTAIGIGKFT